MMGEDLAFCWDTASLQWYPQWDPIGKHALCDVDGNSLKLSDVKDGMSVKIRAKDIFHDYVGYEYLFTAYGLYGKYLAIKLKIEKINFSLISAFAQTY